MYEIIQFLLKDKIIDITASKIVHSQYDLAATILEIVFDNGEVMAVSLTFDQFQAFDEARTKLVIIEDKDDFH